MWVIIPSYFILNFGYCKHGINTIGTHLLSHVTSCGPVQQPVEDHGLDQPTFEHLQYVVACYCPNVLGPLAPFLRLGLCSAW